MPSAATSAAEFDDIMRHAMLMMTCLMSAS